MPRKAKSSKPKRSFKQKKTFKKKSYGRRRTTAIMPTRLFRTFNYRKDFEASTDRTNEQWNSTGLTTYGKKYPEAAKYASMAFLGSHCLTPLGDGSIQNTSGTYSYISENFPVGLTQYGAFYRHAMVHASSIRIDIMPFASTATAYRYVLIPYSVPSAIVDPSGPPLNYVGNGWRPMESGVKTKFDEMTYYELSAQPRAKYGCINAPNSRATVIKYKTMKTKSMLNVKDLHDCHENFEMGMPYTSGLSTENPLTYQATNCTDKQGMLDNDTGEFEDFDTWIWYFRIFNLGQTGNDQSGLCSFSVRIKYFVELYDRHPIEITQTQEWPVA